MERLVRVCHCCQFEEMLAWEDVLCHFDDSLVHSIVLV